MNRYLKKLISGLLSASLAFSSLLPILATEEETEEGSAEAVGAGDLLIMPAPKKEYTYTIDGLGKVTSATASPLGAAGTLYSYICENGSVKQAAYAAVIDTQRGGMVRAESLGTRFGGRAYVSTLESADEDETLLCAVNADFFSTATGVPLGVFMQDGRFVSSSDGNAAIGFDKNGDAFIGYVEDTLNLSHSGDDYEISYLNKYPTVYGVYLLTRDFGETTYLSENVPATEYIIELSEEIAFGERVRGKVKEVRTGTSNGEIPEDCAVLIVPDAYENAEIYADIEKGDRVYIESECGELFEDAVSAVGGGDILLTDGEIAEGLDKEELQTARHPRTAAGITEDGEIILMVVDGRQSGYSTGLKMTELAEAMRAMGAVSAINLDGGGSSVFVTFGSDSATVINKPSDKAQRKVPTALAAYADVDTTEDLHILSAETEHSLLLSGTSIAIELTLTDYSGEAAEFTPDEDDITVSVDEDFGSVKYEDGVIYFAAGENSGYGNVHIEAEYERETVSADLYLTVTNSIDSLYADKTVLLSPTDGSVEITVRAEKNGEHVYIGDSLAVMCENERFVTAVDGEKVTVSLAAFESAEETAEVSETTEPDETTVPEETTAAETTVPEETAAAETTVPDETAVPDETIIPDETTEPDGGEEPAAEPTPPASGRIAVWLLDKTVVIPAYFNDSLSLKLDSFFKDNMTVSLEGHTISYDENGGVNGNGAFVIAPLPEPAEEVAETSDVTAESTETSAPEETASAEETTASEEAVTPEETAAPEETEVTPAPAAEPEEFTVSVSSDALTSDGLRGRRIWMWADGLEPSGNPHALVTVTDSEGNVHEETLYYEMFYDFLDFNGRALLTLTVDSENEGIISLVSPLSFTARNKVQNVSFGPILMSEEYETNLYADTAEHWSSYYVNSLSYMDIVGGSEDLFGNLVFRPDDMLSREQFAKILVNYLRLDTEQYDDVVLEFADNDKIAAWALPFVRAAVGEGLMRGRSTPEDTVVFAPSDPITRQEAFYVLGGLLDGVEPADSAFTDGDRIAAWAAENLGKMFSAGILSGYDDGTVRPEGRITRAESATVVVKIADFTANN